MITIKNPLRMVALIAGVILCSFTGTVRAETKLTAPEEEQFFAELESTLGQVKSLGAKFKQTRHVELFAEDLEATGVTLFVAPNLIRHQIDTPFQTVLISNSLGMARFEKVGAQKEWKKLTGDAVNAMSQVTAQIALWMQGQIRSSNRQYDLSVFKESNGYLVKMVPKNKNMRQNISWIGLTFPLNLTAVSSVTMYEAGGDFTKIDYSGQSQFNGPIDSSVFTIDVATPNNLPVW